MLYLLFFVSGISGLVYEVCWVRQFGNEFGNTVHSAALVTAVFMCGLGVGSWAAGSWADKRGTAGKQADLLAAYGRAELAIALFGVALASALPHLGALSAATSSYTRASDGFYDLSVGSRAVRYAIATLLMAPPSFLMGATLTLLVRYVLADDVHEAGWRIGLLYGVNTGGAALGALASDLLVIPSVGILRAELFAAALNAIVGISALVLSRAHPRDHASEISRTGEGIAPTITFAGSRTVVAVCAALFASGFAALGMELLWFRFLSSALGAYRPVFSLLLTIILAGIWIGSTLGGFMHRRFGRPLALFFVSQSLFAVTTLLFAMTFTRSTGSPYARAFASIATVAFMPSIFMGFSFPLANALVQDTVGAIGRRAGALYLANTIGGVVGSLAVGFVLAPHFGSHATFAVLAACAAIAPLPIVAADRARGSRPYKALLFSIVTSFSVIAWFASLSSGDLLARFLPPLAHGDKILDTREGETEIVQVVERRGARALVTNGFPMSANELPAQRYMRAFSHIPLLMMDKPERVLVICFGVGNTVHAASLHSSLSRIDVADLSRNVLAHAGFFRETNHDVLNDPRVSVFVEDGRQHLRSQPADSYDLITLEPPPIAFAGVASLYSREFYAIARSRLKQGGMVTQWLPAYQVPRTEVLAMVRAFLDVFPEATLLSGYGPELILIGGRDGPVTFDLNKVDARLRAAPAVAEDLRHVWMGTLTELVGSFVADADSLRRATAGVAPVTDDLPSLEYTFAREPEVPATLFALGGVRTFCPTCFEHDLPVAAVSTLGEYMAVLGRLYASDDFRKNRQPITFDARGVEDAIARDAYLRVLLGMSEGREHFARGFRLAQIGHLDEAAHEYEVGLQIAPRDAGAHYDLGALYASTGREDDAVREAHATLAIDPSHAKARAMLCALRSAECAH